MRASSASATAHASSAVGPRDHVEPDAEVERAAVLRRRGRACASTRSRTIVGRLAPREVHVDVRGRDPLGRFGRAAEVDARDRCRAARAWSRPSTL